MDVVPAESNPSPSSAAAGANVAPEKEPPTWTRWIPYFDVIRDAWAYNSPEMRKSWAQLRNLLSELGPMIRDLRFGGNKPSHLQGLRWQFGAVLGTRDDVLEHARSRGIDTAGLDAIYADYCRRGTRRWNTAIVRRHVLEVLVTILVLGCVLPGPLVLLDGWFILAGFSGVLLGSRISLAIFAHLSKRYHNRLTIRRIGGFFVVGTIIFVAIGVGLQGTLPLDPRVLFGTHPVTARSFAACVFATAAVTMFVLVTVSVLATVIESAVTSAGRVDRGDGDVITFWALACLLRDLSGDSPLRTPDAKQARINQLHAAAAALTNAMPKSFRPLDATSRAVVADRYRQAGLALRGYTLWVALPHPGSLADLRQRIMDMILAILQGHYDELPLAPDSSKAIRSGRARALMRTAAQVVFGLIPLGIVVGLKQLDLISIDLYRVLLGPAGLWAFVTLLSLIDSTAKDKLTMVKDFHGLLGFGANRKP